MALFSQPVGCNRKVGHCTTPLPRFGTITAGPFCTIFYGPFLPACRLWPKSCPIAIPYCQAMRRDLSVHHLSRYQKQSGSADLPAKRQRCLGRHRFYRTWLCPRRHLRRHSGGYPADLGLRRTHHHPGPHRRLYARHRQLHQPGGPRPDRRCHGFSDPAPAWVCRQRTSPR